MYDMLGISKEEYHHILSKAQQIMIKRPEGWLNATDHDPVAVVQAKKNAQSAGVDHLIEFETCSFEETVVPEGEGVVVFNPLYGIRIGFGVDLRPLYQSIGVFMINS